MKRSKSFRLPKLRYHRASKQGVVELAGKQHYLGPHGSPECEAAYNKLIAEWLANGKKPVALVKVDALLYQVRLGSYLGQNYGKVTKISETEVTLREIVQDAVGEWIERSGTLLLQEGTK